MRKVLCYGITDKSHLVLGGNEGRGRVETMPRKKLNKAQNIFIMLLLLWFESILNGVEHKNRTHIHTKFDLNPK